MLHQLEQYHSKCVNDGSGESRICVRFRPNPDLERQLRYNSHGSPVRRAAKPSTPHAALFSRGRASRS